MDERQPGTERDVDYYSSSSGWHLQQGWKAVGHGRGLEGPTVIGNNEVFHPKAPDFVPPPPAPPTHHNPMFNGDGSGPDDDDDDDDDYTELN